MNPNPTMKILAFAASNSKTSINKQLVQYAIAQLKKDVLPDAAVELIDLNDYEMPLYRPDREAAGIPEPAQRFNQKISEADALIISFAEHNGSYTSAYKNLFDWTSRIDAKVYQGKPAVLFATSPGQGGAGNVLKTAIESAPFFGMVVKGHVSVPSFQENFDTDSGQIRSPELQTAIIQALNQLK